MVHITYRVNSAQAIASGEDKIVKEAHFWISDDKDHDTLYVQHCFSKHWAWLVERGIRPIQHIVFSDGCASQFKSYRPMFFVAVRCAGSILGQVTAKVRFMHLLLPLPFPSPNCCTPCRYHESFFFYR
jgi:hypothetical protein